VDNKTIPTMRGMQLTDDDVLRRSVISRLLCHCVLNMTEIENEFGIRFHEYFKSELDRLETLRKDGLVSLSREEISVTTLGRIFIRNVGMIFDRYLQKPQTKPTFSKTL
jgi:oxygen-independent coproporphyrinogen-3 oxidase